MKLIKLNNINSNNKLIFLLLTTLIAIIIAFHFVNESLDGATDTEDDCLGIAHCVIRVTTDWNSSITTHRTL